MTGSNIACFIGTFGQRARSAACGPARSTEHRVYRMHGVATPVDEASTCCHFVHAVHASTSIETRLAKFASMAVRGCVACCASLELQRLE